MTPASLVSFLLCIQNKIPLKLSWNDSIKELMEVMLTIMLLLCDFLVKLSKLTQFVILSEKKHHVLSLPKAHTRVIIVSA